MAEMSAAEAAVVLGLSADTIKRRCRGAKLPCRMVDGRWLVDVEVVATPDAGDTALRAELVAVVAHRDSLIAQVSYLQSQLAEAMNAQAELRRLMSMQLTALAAPKADTVTETPRTGRKWWPWQR